jgi:hypothetical protein
LDIHVLKLFHGFNMRMAVCVAGSAGENGIFRSDLLEKFPAGGSAASVMPQYINIAFQIKFRFTHFLLTV